MKKIILTGDRPTGKLHIGHYVGSLRNRVILQNKGDYDAFFIEIADAQAITDNSHNVEKIRQNLIEVALDYLSVGIDPNKVTIFVQSQVPELCELTFYYLDIVSLSRLERNPTVKEELKMRDFSNKTIPVGFLTYPISQAADITCFDANIIPVGEDQLPMIEQTREICRTFNNLYGDVLVEPKELLPENSCCNRLPGIDGKAKMSKSLNNCIYLSDDESTIKSKVMMMFTDPNHLKVSDPGKIEGNTVFTYLDVFCKDEHFNKYLPEFANLDDLKNHYKMGGVGDVKIKLLLNNILQEELAPIRERRKYYEKHIDLVYKILAEGSDKARYVAKEKLIQVKKHMGINYFEDEELIRTQIEKYGKNI